MRINKQNESDLGKMYEPTDIMIEAIAGEEETFSIDSAETVSDVKPAPWVAPKETIIIEMDLAFW